MGAQKCCRECRYHFRKRKCVSLRTGRCCPCSNARCGKAARPAARSTTTTTTTTTTTDTPRVPSEAETEPVSILISRFLTTDEETTFNPTLNIIDQRPIWLWIYVNNCISL